MRQVRIISFTAEGTQKGQELLKRLAREETECICFAPEKYMEPGIKSLPGEFKEWIGRDWGTADYLFIGAAGIAVRLIAPWVRDKFSDPAVVCMDEKGQYVIPLLSGHVGGAVELSKQIAEITGGVPVITTATDLNEIFAVDVFAKKNQLIIKNRELAKKVSAYLLDGGKAGFYSEYPVSGSWPAQLCRCNSREELPGYDLSLAVTGEVDLSKHSRILCLKPRTLAVGIGCRRGTGKEKIRAGLFEILERIGSDVSDVACIASIDLKKEETGLIRLAEELRVPFLTYPAGRLKETGKVSCPSAFVEQTTGVDNVCERAALLAGNGGKIVTEKTIVDKVTYAVVKKKLEMRF